MPAIWIEPFAGPTGVPFPAGIAGGYAQTDSATRSATTLYPLGTLARDANGNEYIYVKAGAAIPINAAVQPNADLADCRQTSAANQAVLGVADAAFANGDNGFILSKGTTNVLTGGAIAAGALLGSAAAGAMAAADATTVATRGAVVLVNSASPQKVRLL